MTRTTKRSQESGFALLVIFLIAAAVAFTMYQEMPRVAFESARDKEQVLMDRGNQYKRAIQVFYAVNKRYPAEIKDLENTNDKRFLRHRYIDPMTGKDEWRLIHTNGSFLTDSLVEKPPAQNAANGLPGQGQTPGGGPLGANNMNTAPGAPATPTAGNPNDPAAAIIPAPLNAAAQRRPSDRGFQPGPGLPQQPVVNPANPNPPGANPFGPNPANFDPNDPRTWPPITLVQPTAQSNGQPNAQPRQLQPPGYGQPQPGAATQTFPPQAFPGQFPPQGVPGQLPGQGGANPQPPALTNPNPFAQNGLIQAPPQSDNPNPAQISINQNGDLTPPVNQTAPVPQPGQPLNNGLPFNGVQPPDLGAGGFNPQQLPIQNPAATGGANPANASGNAPANAALQSINDQLFHPNQAPAAGPTGSPGIAGVASKFEGPSIKAYKTRTKYQEWEFVYEPAANQPTAAQPGQAGAVGSNPQQNQNAPAQGSGQAPSGAAPANPFSMPNPFSQPNPFTPAAPAPTQ